MHFLRDFSVLAGFVMLVTMVYAEPIQIQEESQPILTGCNFDCIEQWDPFCATFNGTERTFGNECELKRDICVTGNDWQIVYEGACKHCNQICPTIYAPFCAENKKGEKLTFGNSCELEKVQCQTGTKWYKKYNGVCKSCSDGCTADYTPVCGVFNGQERTFSNLCDLERTRCVTGQNWRKKYDGACKNCNKLCPTIYIPFCAAGENGQERTFGNDCELQRVRCETGKSWYKIYDGVCRKCNRFCTLDNTPVCGVFNSQERTFSNLCGLEVYRCTQNENWQKKSDGACQ